MQIFKGFFPILDIFSDNFFYNRNICEKCKLLLLYISNKLAYDTITDFFNVITNNILTYCMGYSYLNDFLMKLIYLCPWKLIFILVIIV